MNIKRASLFFLTWLFCLPFCGCFGTGPAKDKIHYYTLEYTAPEITDKKSLPYILKVEPFSIAPVFDTNRIIYKEKKFTRDEYFYHRWRTNPADMVTQLITRDIKASELFSAVLHGESRLQPSHILEGTVEEFLELESEGDRKAVLKACVTLAENNKKMLNSRIIFQKTFIAKANCERKTPAALVHAMSRAMAQISSSLIRELFSCLEDSDKKGASNTGK